MQRTAMAAVIQWTGDGRVSRSMFCLTSGRLLFTRSTEIQWEMGRGSEYVFRLGSVIDL
jgi:hypothetical protein